MFTIMDENVPERTQVARYNRRRQIFEIFEILVNFIQKNALSYENKNKGVAVVEVFPNNNVK